MTQHTDEDLMRRVQHDDVAAFEELYDRHSGRAMRVARGLSGDRELAAEAVQDAFLSVWRKRDRFRANDGSFLAWAMTVTRNRTIDLQRMQAARPQSSVLYEDAIGEHVDHDAGPAVLAARATEAELIRERLEDLPAPQREAIVLAYYGGLSNSEIAERLALPLGTVKGRMRLALAKLREVLATELAPAA